MPVDTSADYEYEVNEDGTATVTKYIGSDIDITVPAELDGHAVTSIGAWAFDYCKNVSSITIPEGVSTIGEWAFSSCKSLSEITIPESVTSIGDSAFNYCTALEQVSLPTGLIEMGQGLFNSCTSLKKVSIPQQIKKLNMSKSYYVKGGFYRLSTYDCGSFVVN